ncbi:cytochrome P450 [Perlucidibaca aquatica]|uniref:cytochrome P450 n=1 Tax=Perlucidibaca aquatica TaxID=1852776 RepID=UPI00083AFF96|nr:cytochrome P450 [Perlucidibaca aquatica]
MTSSVRVRDFSEIPVAGGIPVLSHTFNFLFQPLSSGLNLYERFGPVIRGDAFGLKSVALSGPDAVELVLRNADQAFSNHQGWAYFIERFFHRGLMLLDFDEHKFHRGILQAAFKKPALTDYLHRMQPVIGHGLTRWQKQAKRLRKADFMVYPELKRLTLDIATEVFMGEPLGKEADAINEAFVDCVRAGTALIRYPVPGSRWHKGVRGRATLEAFFRSRITAKRQQPGSDLFSRLCIAEDEQGNRFSDDDVVNHMIFLLMAAHDTSTITLTSMMYQLGKHPDWQRRLRAEALALGKSSLVHDDLSQLPLMELVLKESLRLLSPVHVLPRKTVKPVEFAGYRIPANTYVIISPIVTHHLPQYWTAPTQFDPERFGPERREHKQHAYQYLPFGGGAHMCIGLHFAELEIKAILYQLLLKLRWCVPDDYVMPINFTSLPTPRDHLPVKLHAL